MARRQVTRRGERRQVEQVVTANRESLTLWLAPLVGACADSNSPSVVGRDPIAEGYAGLCARISDFLFFAGAGVESQTSFKEDVVAEFFIVEMLGNWLSLQHVIKRAFLKLSLGCLDAGEANTDCQHTAKTRIFLGDVIHIYMVR